MSLDLIAPRIAAEKTLLDACTVTRAGTGDPVLDRDPASPTYGQLTRPADTAVWSGPCSVTDLGAGGISRVGLDDHTLQNYVARVSVSCDVVKAGDLLTVTSSAGDPSLVGRHFTVSEVSGRTTIVLRRLVLVAPVAAPGIPT